MKTLIGLILLSFSPLVSPAQKAYDVIHYRAALNRQQFELTLGNGYPGASKIRLLSAKPIVFYPDAAVPDPKDQLTFHAKKHSDYFIMNNMRESYEAAPDIIVGRYWTGRRWRILKFVLKR